MNALAKRSPVIPDPLLPAVLDAIDDGILLIDHTHRIAFANLAGLRLSGHSAEQLQGLPFSDLVPGADPTVLLESQQRQSSPQELSVVLPAQRSFRKADGTTMPVELRVTELRSRQWHHYL